MPRIRLLPALLLITPLTLHAQHQVPSTARRATTTLPILMATYLADSGVRTRGLPWSVASALPITWSTAKPVAPSYDAGPGLTLVREGTVQVRASDTSTVEVNLRIYGNENGVQRFVAYWDREALPDARAESALTDAGWTLKLLKCSRETEGFSFGNLLYAAKAPGKTAAGLQETWNCEHDGCTNSFTMYYRKADVEQFDCAGA